MLQHGEISDSDVAADRNRERKAERLDYACGDECGDPWDVLGWINFADRRMSRIAGCLADTIDTRLS
jgi:hypothetical protein